MSIPETVMSSAALLSWLTPIQIEKKNFKNRQGEVFLRRRNDYDQSDSENEDQTFDLEKYGVCPGCLAWINLRSKTTCEEMSGIYRHILIITVERNINITVQCHMWKNTKQCLSSTD